MKASLCPICNGKGKIYPPTFSNPDQAEICHGCGGRGWIEVSEPYFPGTYGGTPYVDKCPACGGDRNQNPLTGCPKGSHYGSYCSVS